MTHGNADINTLLAHLAAKVGTLDGPAQDNRRYCWNLLRRTLKEHPERDPVVSITALIDVVHSGHPSMRYHATNATSFRYLFYNAVKIGRAYREARAASPVAKMEELERRFADHK